jgi:membrane protease YdiL (CAAX protease family)
MNTPSLSLPTAQNGERFLNPAAILFALLYLTAALVLWFHHKLEIGDVVVELALFGAVFPAIAWFATRRATPLHVAPSSDLRELWLALGLVVALAIYLVNGPQMIDQLLPRAWIESARVHFFVVLTKKLVLFVAIPFLLYRFLFGHRLRDFGIQIEGFRALTGRHLAVILTVGGGLLIFQYFLGGAAAPLRQGKFSAYQLLVGLPLCFVWLSVEAGLVEEFFFRAIVQSRFTAWLRSDIGGIALMSLVFGLAHAPGMIFRHAGEMEGLGANPSVLDATAYSIVTLAVSGILFGVLWARTKNLAALICIHAAADLLPNFSDFVKTWQI